KVSRECDNTKGDVHYRPPILLNPYHSLLTLVPNARNNKVHEAGTPRDNAIVFATPARSVTNSRPPVTMSHKRSWAETAKTSQMDSAKADICRHIDFTSVSVTPTKTTIASKTNSSVMIPRSV